MKRLLGRVDRSVRGVRPVRGRRRIRRELGRARLSRRLPSRFRCRSPRRAHRLSPPSSSAGASCSRRNSPPSTAPDGRRRPRRSSRPSVKNGVNPPFSRTSGPDSNSCFGCHNDPVVGGSGDDIANVFVSEGFESAQFDSIDPSFSSERHTIALMGAGLVELLAREMTADLQAIRAAAIAEAYATGKDARADLVTKGVRFGSIVAHPDGIVDLDAIDGVDADLDRQAVQPQGRVHLAAPVHHQRAQRPPRHGGGRAVRRALDRQPRLRRERRARRDDGRRRFRAGRVPGDLAAADGEGRSARRLAPARPRPAPRRSTRSAAPPATCRPCR